jgi:RNA polymerase sporulation-specific sigma factor
LLDFKVFFLYDIGKGMIGGHAMFAHLSQNQLLKTMKDEEVVLLAQQGQEYASEYLLHKYRHIIRSKAKPYFLTGADQEDILQEGWIGLHKAIRDFQYEKGIPFKHFAELCVSRQIITAVKTSTRLKHSPLNSYISLNKPVYDDGTDRTLIDMIPSTRMTDPEEVVMNREELATIKAQLMETLSKFEYNVFLLYLKKASYQEIANQLKTSTKAVDNALCRIKRKIGLKMKPSSN